MAVTVGHWDSTVTQGDHGAYFWKICSLSKVKEISSQRQISQEPAVNDLLTFQSFEEILTRDLLRKYLKFLSN